MGGTRAQELVRRYRAVAIHERWVIAKIPYGTGREIRVRVVEADGKARRTQLDVRLFVDAKGFRGPTKQGFMLDACDVKQLLSALDKGLPELPA
jgi:hypothetical protein